LKHGEYAQVPRPNCGRPRDAGERACRSSAASAASQAVDPLVDAIGMASRRPGKRVSAKKARASASASARGSDLADDLRSLGEGLATRVPDVVEQTLTRARQQGVDPASGEAIPGVSAGSPAQITEASTFAIARWLEGDRPARESESAQQTWQFYGELAATREASLNDVIMHCLC
jgi:hypothetical protein